MMESLLKFDKVNVVRLLDVTLTSFEALTGVIPRTLIVDKFLFIYDGQRNAADCQGLALPGAGMSWKYPRSWEAGKSVSASNLGLADKESCRGHLVYDNPNTNTNRTSTS